MSKAIEKNVGDVEGGDYSVAHIFNRKTGDTSRDE